MRHWRILLPLVVILIFHPLQITAYDIGGSYTSLKSELEIPYSSLEGKVSIVETMATWCQPCKSEFFELYKVYTSTVNNTSNIQILSLSISPATDTPVKLQKFKQEAENEFSFKAMWEFGLDQDNDFSEFFEITIIPTTLILAPNGTLLKQWEGLVTAELIISFLKTEITYTNNFNPSPINQLLNNTLFKVFIMVVILLVFYRLFVPKE